MAAAEIQTRSIARAAGLSILTAVPVAWVALSVWTSTDPCTINCTYLGRRGHGYLLWLVTLAAVPLAAWLLVYAYRGDKKTEPRFSAAAAVKLLYLFTFGVFVLAAFAGVRLIDDLGNLWRSAELGFEGRGLELTSRRGVVYSGFSVVWFSLIGVSTVLGARALDRGRRSRMSFVAVWAGVAAAVLVGFSGGVAGLLDPEAGLAAFYQELTDTSEGGAEEPLPIRTSGTLPVSIVDARSGYTFSGARVEIAPGDYLNLGTYYMLFLDGDWTGPGEPQGQACTYRFLSSEGAQLLERERFAFEDESPRHFEDVNVASFYEAHMEGRPASAEVDCRDLVA